MSFENCYAFQQSRVYNFQGKKQQQNILLFWSIFILFVYTLRFFIFSLIRCRWTPVHFLKFICVNVYRDTKTTGCSQGRQTGPFRPNWLSLNSALTVLIFSPECSIFQVAGKVERKPVWAKAPRSVNSHYVSRNPAIEFFELWSFLQKINSIKFKFLFHFITTPTIPF